MRYAALSMAFAILWVMLAFEIIGEYPTMWWFFAPLAFAGWVCSVVAFAPVTTHPL